MHWENSLWAEWRAGPNLLPFGPVSEMAGKRGCGGKEHLVPFFGRNARSALTSQGRGQAAQQNQNGENHENQRRHTMGTQRTSASGIDSSCLLGQSRKSAECAKRGRALNAHGHCTYPRWTKDLRKHPTSIPASSARRCGSRTQRAGSPPGNQLQGLPPGHQPRPARACDASSQGRGTEAARQNRTAPPPTS